MRQFLHNDMMLLCHECGLLLDKDGNHLDENGEIISSCPVDVAIYNAENHE